MINITNKEKEMLEKAIESAGILSSGQKKVLKTVCFSDYPLSTTDIASIIGCSKQASHLAIKNLFERKFILREKDSFFVYKPNPTRMEELKEKYIQKQILKDFI